jgi:hypothetical protein
MKPIERTEVLPLSDYEGIRGRFRQRIIQEKRTRRVAIGPQMTMVFENRDTVLMQIQEMLRTERITKESAIQYEIDTYNELVPQGSELSATLFVEILDRDERERMLVALAGLEEHLFFAIDGDRIPFKSKERAGQVAERTTAVHYLKVDLGEHAERFSQGKFNRCQLLVDHAAYQAAAELQASVVTQLAGDLTWSA